MNLNPLRIALAFSGCFLGAGFVSGQELWQFFISFGWKGAVGLALASFLIFVFGVLLLRLASVSKISECDKLIIRKENKFLRAFIGVSEVFFLAGFVVIMTAGVGALFEQTLSLSKYATTAFFVIVLFVLSLGGHRRMVAVFSVTVPLLVLFTVIVCIVSVAKFGFPDIMSLSTSADNNGNVLLSGWWISSVTFVCYNLFSSVPILAPLGVFVDSKKKIVLGVFGGTAVLFLIASGIFISMSLCPEASQASLPMLYAASKLSGVLGFIYAFLLFFGMLGTALSCGVAVIHYVVEKSGKKNIKSPCALAVCVVSYFGGLIGFGELIGILYPICGYLGVLAIAALAEHYFNINKMKKSENKNEQKE